MSADSRITALIEKAFAAGISQEALVGMLAARGWPEKEIYEALAEHYERVAAVEIPHRAGSGANAKEAFFYLLIFATLGTWTIAFGLLASWLIDRWLTDPLFSGSAQGFDSSTIAGSLAAVMVAFPFFLLLSRAVAADTAAHPERLESPIRRWLIYMAMVIAASVFMCDLITALSYFLRGELTSRFLLKALVVLVLSGGVFFYYFAGLRKTEDAGLRRRRDRTMTLVSSAAVVLLAVLGFTNLGAPRRQRDLRADEQRVFRLYQLSGAIENYWRTHNSTLPASADQLPGPFLDPLTHRPLEYRPRQGGHYEVCAQFAQNRKRADEAGGVAGTDEWTHPAGGYCFQLDVSSPTSFPMGVGAY